MILWFTKFSDDNSYLVTCSEQDWNEPMYDEFKSIKKQMTKIFPSIYAVTKTRFKFTDPADEAYFQLYLGFEAGGLEI